MTETFELTAWICQGSAMLPDDGQVTTGPGLTFISVKEKKVLNLFGGGNSQIQCLPCAGLFLVGGYTQGVHQNVDSQNVNNQNVENKRP